VLLCRVVVPYYTLQVPVSLVHDVLTSHPATANLALRYDAYAMRSFVEDNRALVWCTGATTMSSLQYACLHMPRMGWHMPMLPS
jgi:hypothetical protein